MGKGKRQREEKRKGGNIMGEKRNGHEKEGD